MLWYGSDPNPIDHYDSPCNLIVKSHQAQLSSLFGAVTSVGVEGRWIGLGNEHGDLQERDQMFPHPKEMSESVPPTPDLAHTPVLIELGCNPQNPAQLGCLKPIQVSGISAAPL